MRQAEIERLLPGVYRQAVKESLPLAAILQVMEGFHQPLEDALEGLDGAFDPYRAPDRMVPYLARWVDLDRLGAVEIGRLRELIAAAAHLSRWRGTARGMKWMLETATGVKGFVVEDRLGKPFHVRVSAPAGAEAHRGLIERIVEQEKPAYVTSEILFG